MIFIDVLLFIFGLLLLYIGADLLVRGSSRLALIAKISPMIVGLTVVAFGTSSPEFLVSFVAALDGNIDVAIGNIVGSNIANIGLVLGLSVFLLPIVSLKEDVKKELYWMVAVTVLFWLFAMDNELGQIEGTVLFIGIILFTAILARQSIKHRTNSKDVDVPILETGWTSIDKLSRKSRVLVFGLWALLGIIILAYGSNVTIDAAVAIATELGISQVVIGLTMVAFGTSLPELATGIISVIKKENEILIGNVIGSNLFNILAVAGPIAIFFPIPISDRIIWFDFPIMLMFSFVLFIVLLIIKRIGRISGLLFSLAYLTYIYWIAFVGVTL